MQRKSSMVSLVLAISLIVLPVSTWAMCEQADLEGTWSTQVWGGCPSGTQCWDQCTLTIGSDGSIQAVGTYIDCSGVTSNITGGQLTVYPGGRIQGTIVTSDGTLEVGPGGIVGDQLVLGTDQ